jgi:dCMP deaminase
MKEKFVKLYMDMAQRVSELSYAQRLKVGAVIVKDDTVISYGYNGMPAGWDNICEDVEYSKYHQDYVDPGTFRPTTVDEIKEQFPLQDETGRYFRLITKPEVLHAESNAIAKLARSTNSGLGADLFVTHSPCLGCAKLIYQSGIRRVFYSQDYRDDSGIQFLWKSGITITKV